MTLKVVSFNINGLRARLHQLSALIDKHQPDIIGLQETKVHDEQFPQAEVEALGYHVIFHGQKSHYGVALLSKQPLLAPQWGFPTDAADAQRRMIMGDYVSASGQRIRILNGYFPQGESRDHPLKFPAKQQFYADLQQYLEQHADPQQAVIVMGDVNISHQDIDVGIGADNAKRWLATGKCSFLPEERAWLNRLLGWGLHDTFRHCHPQLDEQYSWFDYRSRGFDDNRGLRIDLIMASAPLISRCTGSGIDYELRGIEKPSDHAPVWSSFDLNGF